MQKPYVAVDTVVFTIINARLSILLIQINAGEYAGKWAVPGALVRIDESLDDAAIRVLNEKARLKNVYMEQLYTFGDPDRDKRGRSVSVAYFSLIANPKDFEIEKKEYYQDIMWCPVKSLPEMAFDHKDIIKTAHERLKSKLSYTNIVYSLLPKEFTFSHLQRIYEIVLEKKLDKRNFRKKISSLDFLVDLNRLQTDVTHRPAKLYSIKKKALEVF